MYQEITIKARSSSENKSDGESNSKWEDKVEECAWQSIHTIHVIVLESKQWLIDGEVLCCELHARTHNSRQFQRGSVCYSLKELKTTSLLSNPYYVQGMAVPFLVQSQNDVEMDTERNTCYHTLPILWEHLYYATLVVLFEDVVQGREAAPVARMRWCLLKGVL